MLLFVSYCYLFLLLCLCILKGMFRSRFSVSFCCSVYCLYVNVHCTTVALVTTHYQLTNTSYHIILYIWRTQATGPIISHIFLNMQLRTRVPYVRYIQKNLLVYPLHFRLLIGYSNIYVVFDPQCRHAFPFI